MLFGFGRSIRQKKGGPKTASKVNRLKTPYFTDMGTATQLFAQRRFMWAPAFESVSKSIVNHS